MEGTTPASDQDWNHDSAGAELVRLHVQGLADLAEAVNRMRMLARRLEGRQRELIWHFDIQPLERDLDLLRWRMQTWLAAESRHVGAQGAGLGSLPGPPHADAARQGRRPNALDKNA
jgi:hypothetical protein